MSISILGGIARGLLLATPPTNQTRPTAVQLKRRIFDAFQNLEGYHFVDLCAGSGSIGIEAWSRGAESSTLVESSKKAQSIINTNISKIKSKYSSEFEQYPLKCMNSTAEQWVSGHLDRYNLDNLIIFFDPPYEKKNIYESVLSTLVSVKFTGELWLECDKQKGAPYEYWLDLTQCSNYRVYKQGTSYILRINFGQNE